MRPASESSTKPIRPRPVVTLASVWLLCFASQLAAQSGAPRGEPASAPAFIHASEVWGVALVLTAGFAADQRVRDNAQDWRSPISDLVANIATPFGDPRVALASLGGVYLVGRALNLRPVSQASWRAGEAVAISLVVTAALKVSLGRARPFEREEWDAFDPFSGRRSFPSGHTATAFALATTLAAETKDHVSDVGFYALATLTGLSRINDDRHWLTDVLTGAAVGHLVGRWVARGGGVSRLIVNPSALGIATAF